MGAFADALDLGAPSDSPPVTDGRIDVYKGTPKEKASPFALALANKDAVAPPASFDDRFGEMPPKKDFSWSQAVTDIPHEIASDASNAVDKIKALGNRADQGPVEGLITTGKAALAVPQLLASPITGAARSLIGHTLANAEHAAGTKIAPDIATKDDPGAMYETAKGDTDKAMSAMAGRDVPVAAPAAAAPSIQELKLAASKGFDHPEVTALEIKPKAIKDFSQTSQLALNADGIDETLAPKTFAVLGKIENHPTGAVVTGHNLQSMRRALGHAAASPDPTERLAASTAIDHLDNFLPNISKNDVISGDVGKASQILDEARANYSAAKHAETIDNKTIQAELRAAAANSGMNVANTVRQRMADILIKPKEQRGFSKDQLAQMETIVRGSKTQNAIRASGNLMGGGGGLGAAVTGGIGALATPGGVGGLIPVVGLALKSISNRMTITQAAKLSESIRSSAPLASSAQKLQAAQTAMGQSRNAKTVAGVVMASRNFANNLKGIGISIAPNDIARSLLQSQAAPESKNRNPGSEKRSEAVPVRAGAKYAQADTSPEVHTITSGPEYDKWDEALQKYGAIRIPKGLDEPQKWLNQDHLKIFLDQNGIEREDKPDGSVVLSKKALVS